MTPGPNPDCESCCGEGVDGDPYGMFDYTIASPCSDCWPAETEVEPLSPTDALIAAARKLRAGMNGRYVSAEDLHCFDEALAQFKSKGG